MTKTAEMFYHYFFERCESLTCIAENLSMLYRSKQAAYRDLLETPEEMHKILEWCVRRRMQELNLEGFAQFWSAIHAAIELEA
jgi:hypothetical protein